MWTMVWKEAVQFWRYKMLLIFAVLIPVVQLQGVARLSGRRTMELPMAVYDADRSSSSRQLIEMLTISDLFEVETHVESAADVERLLERGEVRAGLIIPPAFQSRLARAEGARVQMLLDGSEPAAASRANAYLESAAPLYAQRLSDALVGPGLTISTTIEPRSRVWFNEEMREEAFRLPGSLASSVAMLAIFLTAAVIVKERETGTLEQLFVTPMQPFELIVSKGSLALVITYVGFLEMLALCVFHYDIPMRGSVTLLMGLTVFYIFVEMGLGLIISVIAQTQGQALLAAFFWSLLERILSGQILPVENMPRPAQVAAQLAPLTHFTAIVRKIMLKGSGLTDLGTELLALTLLGIGLYAIATRRLTKTVE
jgi:ABC-2 type transport system permease protein